MGLGVMGLKDLMPKDSGASQRSAQFMQQAQNQKYIPQGNGGGKSVGGAISTGLSGVMAGQSLSSLLPPAASTATTTAATGGGLASLGLGAGTAAGEFAMPGIGAGMAAGATEAAIPSVVAAGAGETAVLGGAAAGAGLSTAAVAPWAVGALALGSYLFS